MRLLSRSTPPVSASPPVSAALLSSRIRKQCLVAAACFAVLAVVCASASAQQTMLGGSEPNVSYPSRTYYAALEVYRDGDLEEAVELFDQALRRSRRDINGRWIDAIPAFAMQAECFWHLGNLAGCKANLDLISQIVDRHRGWIGRVDWSSALKGNVQVAPERGLWPAAAGLRQAPIADKMRLESGTPLSGARLRAGGTIEEPNIKQIDIAAVMRGLAVASYRRRIVMGPLANGDPLANAVLDSTKYPRGVAPVGRTLIGAMRVAEKFAAHDDKEVLSEAATYQLLGGQIHPMTPVALMCQASVLAGGEKPGAAIPVAMQAANAAAAAGQPEWIGEALQLAAGCVGSRQEADAVASFGREAIQALANGRVSRLAVLHGSIASADAAISSDQSTVARQFLSSAESIASRRDVVQPRLDAYWGYVAARIAAANGESLGTGNGGAVNSGLTLISNFAFNRRFRGRSLISIPRVFQLELIRQSIGSTLGGNQASELLDQYVQDPPVEVWRRDPVDGLAASLYNRAAAEAAWVGIAASQTEGRELMRRVDFVLGSRFLRRLPMAGRLVQVRHLASAEEALLVGEAKQLRMQAPPPIARLRQAVAAGAGGGAGPSVEELEALACQAALARMPLPRTMPPPLNVEDVTDVLPSRTGMLTFFFAGDRLHAALAADGNTQMWTVPGASRLSRQIAAVLRGIGVGKTRGDRLPKDDSWKQDAITLRDQILTEDIKITARELDELIIVPDGPLWYLPLELLPVENADGPLLGETVKVRYAATPGLAIHPVAPPASTRTVGVIASSFFAPRDLEINGRIVDSITEVLEDPVRLPGTEPRPSSLIGDTVGHLLVAATQAVPADQPLKLGVGAYDASSPSGSLAAWLRFPTTAPRSVVLAGFRTPVGLGRMGTGEELFFTICGLHASGVRDVVVSRWAVGGNSSAILMRELMQELPFTGMSDAWFRAVAMLRESEIDPAGEPLLMQSEHKRQGVTGKQPLFWASYLLASPLDREQIAADKVAAEP